MSKPLIVSYTSDYGIASTSYHVVDEINYNKLSSPNTTISASIYLDKLSYQSSSTALLNYSYKFDMDITSINNPISQSYEILKGYNNANPLSGKNGSEFFINFSTATQDS